MPDSDKWNQIVTKAILSDTACNITQVIDLQVIQSLPYDRDKYPSIISSIRDLELETLKAITDDNRTGFREFLDTIRFSDQNRKVYIATIYDSDELWQDPEIIDIFLLK